MSGMLLRRLEGTTALTPAGLPAAVVQLLLRVVFPMLGHDMGASRLGSKKVNVADATAAEVRTTLNHLEPLVGSPVVVLLVAERDGVVMEWPEVTAYFDDLWYPGSDDLLVLGTATGGFVALSHEEELVYGEL